MKAFRTIVKTSPSDWKIGLNDKILTLGSCFSDAIGSRLSDNKFQTLVNPFGVIYDPVSLHRLIDYAIKNDPLPPDSYLNHQDVHLNYYLHSSFSSLQKEALEKKITELISTVHSFLSSCQFVFITYGTSWTYSLAGNSEIVANCHKQPSRNFMKTLLSVESVVESFKKTHDSLLRHNPAIKTIITLSPVRHLKDTLELNSVSKAVLRAACHYLAEHFTNVEYFPAYEIMMDDLRDYRFYKADMIHPNEVAEEYIWEKFVEKSMDSPAQEFLQEWKSILSSLRHRAFHPASAGHQIFLQQTMQKLMQLQHSVNVDAEINSIQAQLLDSFNTNKNP